MNWDCWRSLGSAQSKLVDSDSTFNKTSSAVIGKYTTQCFWAQDIKSIWLRVWGLKSALITLLSYLLLAEYTSSKLLFRVEAVDACWHARSFDVKGVKGDRRCCRIWSTIGLGSFFFLCNIWCALNDWWFIIKECVNVADLSWMLVGAFFFFFF